MLHACEPGSRSFDTAAFSDAERHEAVLAGEAQARIVRRRGAVRTARPSSRSRCEPGVRLALDLRERGAAGAARSSGGWSRCGCTARAAIPGRAANTTLADGALLHQSAGDIRASRHEMMLALLGRMGRAEAAPVMAAIAREPGDASLRWQALRECLALDTAAGFAALCDARPRGRRSARAPRPARCARS